MKPSVSRVLAAALSLMVISGCSVKEERDACPCRLFLDLQSVDRIDQTPCLLRIISDDGFEYSSVIGGRDFQDTYIVDVPRAGLNVVVWSGAEGYMDEQGVLIPLGNGCPPVYVHSSRVDAAGESVCETVCLRKNYCILNVSVDSPGGVDGMMVRGEVEPGIRVMASFVFILRLMFQILCQVSSVFHVRMAGHCFSMCMNQMAWSRLFRCMNIFLHLGMIGRNGI